MPRLKEPAAASDDGAAKAPDPAEESTPKLVGLATDSLEEGTDFINALWYGRPGTGKTSALATMANSGRMLLINAEAGIKKRPLQRLGVQVANIQVLPKKGQDLTFDLLEDTYWQLKDDLQRDPASWVGVGWDSLTEIYKKLLEQVVASQVAKAERMGRERDRFFTDRADWGVMIEQVRLLFRRYRDLPCHFGVTALERRDQDEEDGHVTYVPALTPALQADVMGYVDICCHTVVRDWGDDDEYQGAFRPSGKYEAKDRTGSLPRFLVDPTFERILEYSEDRLDEESDPIMKAALERRAQEKSHSGPTERESEDNTNKEGKDD